VIVEATEVAADFTDPMVEFLHRAHGDRVIPALCCEESGHRCQHAMNTVLIERSNEEVLERKRCMREVLDFVSEGQ